MAISFWETKHNPEVHNRTGYPEISKTLAKVIEGTPKVETFDLSSSTLHNLAAKGV